MTASTWQSQGTVGANDFMGNAGSKRNTKVAADNHQQTSVTIRGASATATSAALNGEINQQPELGVSQKASTVLSVNKRTVIQIVLGPMKKYTTCS